MSLVNSRYKNRFWILTVFASSFTTESLWQGIKTVIRVFSGPKKVPPCLRISEQFRGTHISIAPRIYGKLVIYLCCQAPYVGLFFERNWHSPFTTYTKIYYPETAIDSLHMLSLLRKILYSTTQTYVTYFKIQPYFELKRYCNRTLIHHQEHREIFALTAKIKSLFCMIMIDPSFVYSARCLPRVNLTKQTNSACI